MDHSDLHSTSDDELRRAILSNLPNIVEPALEQATVGATPEQVEKINKALAKLNMAKENPSAVSVVTTANVSIAVEPKISITAPATKPIATPTLQQPPFSPVMASVTQAPENKRFKPVEKLEENGKKLLSAGIEIVGPCAIFGIAFTLAGLSAHPIQAGLSIIGVVAFIAAVLLAYLPIEGASRLRLASFFKDLQAIVGDRDSCTIKELSARTGMSEERVRAKVQKLLRLGCFPEGRMDITETTLMLTNESYQKYRQHVAELSHARARTPQRMPAPAAQRGAVPSKASRFIQAGRAYVKRMRELDVAIADEDVSARIVSISRVVGRMLNRVKNDPSTIDSLSKLMDYYLPTTIKLLETYDDLEKEPVQGQNIASLRDEIESALDVLDIAYQKLLDESYRDTSLEVSSDISALNVVLAQEGLIRTPFDGAPEAAEHPER